MERRVGQDGRNSMVEGHDAREADGESFELSGEIEDFPTKDSRRLIQDLTSTATRVQSNHRIDLPSLKLQSAFAAKPENQYEASDLLKYYDRDLVENVFLAVFKRAPNETELASELERLRSGRVNKTEFIESLLHSDEGTKSNVRINGLKSPAARRISQLPVLGYFMRLLISVARLPVAIRHQQQFQTFSLGQQQQIVDYVNELRDEFLEHSLEVSIIADVSEAIAMLFDALAEASGKLAFVQAELSRVLDELARHQKESEALKKESEALKKESEALKKEIEALNGNQEASAASNREFLIQEQAAIVGTQKMAIAAIEDQLKELLRMQQQLSADLFSQQERLESIMERQDI